MRGGIFASTLHPFHSARFNQMKRHADQLRQEAETTESLHRNSIVRIDPNSPYCFADRGHGDFYFRVAMATAAHREHFHYAFCVNRFEADQFELKPLPRDREIIPDGKRSEIERMRVRREYVEYISKRIADSLMAEFEKLDPKFGYSEDEWRQMHPTYDHNKPWEYPRR